jgi:2',3'-cyclic-nucleotide 2'-phosphodiesterase (5'-nucleotidase family)
MMLKKRRRFLFQPLILSWLLLSCQATLSPTAQLPAETDIQLNQAISADAQAEALIAPYRQQVNQKMNEVIGRATTELNGRTGKVETNLGNFVADLQQAQAARLTGKPVDMGVITRGGLRAVIPQGEVKVGDIFEVMPFENELLVLTLSGQTVQQMFQYAAEKKNLSVSNATYTIRNNIPEDIRIGGRPFDLQRTYTIAISDYLAYGGDDMNFLKNALRTDKAGILLREAIIRQIRDLTAQSKPVEAAIDGRVKIL